MVVQVTNQNQSQTVSTVDNVDRLDSGYLFV